MYRAGWLRARRLPIPVVSVGNVTWGGAGKTPMVVLLAEAAARRGLRALVLTRGYGGDEEKMLRARLAGVASVAAGADRAAAAARALRAAPADLVLLDDGLQHHALARDAQARAPPPVSD
jgi:tetraacyldisaccharide 4'-kinase